VPYLLPLPSLDAFWHDNLYRLHTAPVSAATAETLAEWESRNGFRLPDSLHSLYLQNNGGVSDWLDAIVGPEGPVSLHAVFGNAWSGLIGRSTLRGATLGEVSDGIDFGEDDADYRHAFGADADRMWVVANYGSSHYLLLDYRGGAQPAVTLFDDDSRFYGDGSRRGDGLYVLARTFDDMLTALRREIAHPLRVWTVEGVDTAALAERLVARLDAVAQPPGRMRIDDGWHPQYGQDHLHLPDPYLAEEFQPDFGLVRQFTGGTLGAGVLRVYRNHSEQHTRAERFAGDGAVLVSLGLPTETPCVLPAEACDVVESVLDDEVGPWKRWLDTDTAEFVGDDDMKSPYIDHPGSGDSSLSSAAANRA
jgi:hypothetical protein